MDSIFEELKEMLQLEYVSDLRYANKDDVTKAVNDLYDSGKYTESEIRILMKYIAS